MYFRMVMSVHLFSLDTRWNCRFAGGIFLCTENRLGKFPRLWIGTWIHDVGSLRVIVRTFLYIFTISCCLVGFGNFRIFCLRIVSVLRDLQWTILYLYLSVILALQYGNQFPVITDAYCCHSQSPTPDMHDEQDEIRNGSCFQYSTIVRISNTEHKSCSWYSLQILRFGFSFYGCGLNNLSQVMRMVFATFMRQCTVSIISQRFWFS